MTVLSQVMPGKPTEMCFVPDFHVIFKSRLRLNEVVAFCMSFVYGANKHTLYQSTEYIWDRTVSFFLENPML